MSIESGLDLIWASDFVQRNPKRSYKTYYPAEYPLVEAYLNDGPEPDFLGFSKLGRGLCEIEKARRGETPPGPPALVSSSIKAGDTLTGTVNWAVEASNAAAVEFWANDGKLSEDTTVPYSYSFDTTTLPEGTNALGLGIRGLDGSRITPQIGQVTVDNEVQPPPTGDPLWNADLSTGNVSQYGDWEYGGTFDGTPPFSARVSVASSLDGYGPAQGDFLMRMIVAPGDQYGGSTGWRTVTRIPPEYTNNGNIVIRTNGYDSSYTWAVLLPPGYPGDANLWMCGTEWHASQYIPVAPNHFRIFSNDMAVDVAGNVNGSTTRIEYVNEHFLSGYEHGKWYVFTERYKHGVAPDGIYQLWYGKKGTDTTMKPLISRTGIGTMYQKADLSYDGNYMLFGLYRGQSGTIPSTAYFGGYREYATSADALAWAEQILAS